MAQEPHRPVPTWRRIERSMTGRNGDTPAPSSDTVAASTTRSRRRALGVLLVLSFLVAVRLAAPVWVGIVFGLLMAFTAQPLHSRLASRLNGSRKRAAFLTVLGAGGVSVLAGSVAVYILTREVTGAVSLLQSRVEAEPLTGILGEQGGRLIARFGLSEAELVSRIQGELGRVTGFATQVAAVVLETTTTAVLGLFIGCITMYYTLVDWPSISARLERVLPLDPRHTRALVLEFREVGRSALLGIFATAAVQAVLATLGYALFGLPHAVSWGLLTGIASFVPVVATALVWVPVSLYFITNGAIAFGVLQALWGLFFITGFGEYVLRPRLVGGQGRGQPLLILVAALGGIQLFGLPGIVVGPVLMSLFLAVLRIYEREVGASDRQDTQPLFSSVEASTPEEHR